MMPYIFQFPTNEITGLAPPHEFSEKKILLRKVFLRIQRSESYIDGI